MADSAAHRAILTRRPRLSNGLRSGTIRAWRRWRVARERAFLRAWLDGASASAR
jgi:hypothetical protein